MNDHPEGGPPGKLLGAAHLSRWVRTASALILWALILLAGSHRAGTWYLNRMAFGLLGACPIQKVALANLTLEGGPGEGIFRGERIAWGAFHFSPGRGGWLSHLELGPRGGSLLRVEEVRLNGSFEVAGSIRRAEIDLLRPEWEKLFQAEEGAPGRHVLVLALTVSDLRIRTPFGPCTGRGAVSTGRGGRPTDLAMNLDCPGGLSLVAQGMFQEGGFTAEVWGEGPGSEPRLRARAHALQGTWNLTATLDKGGVTWLAEGGGEPCARRRARDLGERRTGIRRDAPNPLSEDGEGGWEGGTCIRNWPRNTSFACLALGRLGGPFGANSSSG